ncbi:leucyl-tRNA synthetase [Perkinsela sp. CCAP 1560/4]|nr:leucyl-tRNA synthetase [Perkinsela sp. CCAP 1560/4]|eukprot:KNH04725.1 leucyl-tRNA synthetase [Perkinsela sp. CCAP 1560/4]
MSVHRSSSCSKLDKLKDIELVSKARWESFNVFEVDAPVSTTRQKYFITFPYPYMNGALHLGHAFSLSKAEFAAGFQRMLGKIVLWPFAFHGTGMPIAACAKKLAEEVSEYGNPPVFPIEMDTMKEESSSSGEVKFKGKKGKKVSAAKKQWKILEEMGCKEIANFIKPEHWLEVFPRKALEDLRSFGCRIDYRRAFITTELNPFYDSFIKWQFNLLKCRKKIHYGRRLTIFSPKDNQPCQDHDRAVGEGVVPLEYTIIKLQVCDTDSLAKLLPDAEISSKRVYLAAATLRPETMYGQTNCWVSSKILYKAFQVDGDTLIMTQRSATNLSFQKENVGPCLFSIKGQDLMGIKVLAPMSYYREVYVLPLDTIDENKGTGIVTSVPSESPEDHLAFTALRKKPEYREKLGILDKWITPFIPIATVVVPGVGESTNIAEEACKMHKVSSVNDRDKLLLAKKEAYKQSHYRGIMADGLFKGKLASDAKLLARDHMIADNQAFIYAEPDGLVVSRSGDTCVVALTDQWYLSYGEDEWKSQVMGHIENSMNFFNEQVKNGMVESTNWLKEWACSRSFGLGTKLPFGEGKGEIIDSLSDSTIYMAYYTVSHILQGLDNIDGRRPSSEFSIQPKQMTDDVWSYIFFGTPLSTDTGIPSQVLERMRREFLFWYPVDLRVSGKDLIQNHLVMSLYNHAAVWNEDSSQWPQAFFCNGHILIDKEKMSKSKGNFKTLKEAIHEYSSDATRIALADAGDTLDDPNFVTANMHSIISKLSNLVEFCESFEGNKPHMRCGERNLCDEIFMNDIATTVKAAHNFYEKMQFRAALHCVFYDFINLRESWKQLCGSKGMHSDLVQTYITIQAKLLCPIAPHVAEYIYQNFTPTPGVSIQCEAQWPEVPAPCKKHELTRVLIQETMNEIRSQIRKNERKTPKVDSAQVFCCSEYTGWQKGALRVLRSVQQEAGQVLRPREPFPKTIIEKLKESSETARMMQDSLSFLAYMIDHELNKEIDCEVPIIDDYRILTSFMDEIKTLTGLNHLTVLDRTGIPNTDNKFKLASKSCISRPMISLTSS